MEIEIIRFIQQFKTPFLDSFFQVITFIGEDTFIIFLFTLIFWCISKDLLICLG